jgi:hypothetical protein
MAALFPALETTARGKMSGDVARDRCSNSACVLPCVHVDPPGHELTVAVALVGNGTALDPGQLLGEGNLLRTRQIVA